MGWSLVATAKNDAKYANPTQTSPLTVAVPTGTAVGDVIDVLFQYGTSGTTDITGLAATDNATSPNTYQQTGTTNFDGGLQQGMAAFRAVVTDASATTISISWTGNANGFLAGIAHTRRHSAGHVTSDPLTGTPNKANQATPGTGTDAVSSGTTTPAVNGALIVGYLIYPGNLPGSTTHGTGFTLALDDTATAQQASEWLEQTTAAAKAATWTEGATAQPAMSIVFAFAPPSGATAYTLSAGAGSYAITGAATTLRTARKLSLAPGTLTLSGTATRLPTGRKLALAAGSYGLTGTAVLLPIARRLGLAPGSYVLTGDPATLTGPGAAHFILTAVPGSYALTGSLIRTPAAWHLQATAAAYVLTGAATTLSGPSRFQLPAHQQHETRVVGLSTGAQVAAAAAVVQSGANVSSASESAA